MRLGIGTVTVRQWRRLVAEGERDLEEMHERLEEANETILQGIRAPWAGLSSWWIMDACQKQGHPTKHPEDPPSAPCCCGFRK